MKPQHWNKTSHVVISRASHTECFLLPVFSWEILIAGQWKKPHKAVKKTQLYYSVWKRWWN